MLLLTPACVLPSHLLRQLLFSSHTSLLVLNWWEHRGTSVNDTLRVNETDLFPGFSRQLCSPDLVRQSAPVLSGISGGSVCHQNGTQPDKVILYAQHRWSTWISLPTWVGDGLSNFACRQPFLLTFQQWVIAETSINRHSKVILASQVGAYGQRAWNVWETRAASKQLARSSNHAAMMFWVVFFFFFRLSPLRGPINWCW